VKRPYEPALYSCEKTVFYNMPLANRLFSAGYQNPADFSCSFVHFDGFVHSFFA